MEKKSDKSMFPMAHEVVSDSKVWTTYLDKWRYEFIEASFCDQQPNISFETRVTVNADSCSTL